MAQEVDVSFAVLAKHIRFLLDRQQRTDEYLSRLDGYLSGTDSRKTMGPYNPIQNQSQLYLCEVTSKDSTNWYGVRKWADSETSSTSISALATRPIKGYSSSSLPEVGAEITAMWIGNVVNSFGNEVGVYIEVAGRSAPDMLRFTTGSYSSLDNGRGMITATGTPTELPSGTPGIPAGIYIYDRNGAEWLPGEEGHAIYQANVFDDSEEEDSFYGAVNWVVVPAFRRRNFRLTEVKARNLPDPTVSWQDKDLVDISAATGKVFDPHGKYAGKADAKGVANLVLDPQSNRMRWEIDHLNGYALTVCGHLNSAYSGSSVDMQVTSYEGPDWMSYNPGAIVKMESCLYTTLAASTQLRAILKNPDTDPPTYELMEIKSDPSSGGGGSYTFGCGLTEAGGSVTFNASLVAGKYLTVDGTCGLKVDAGCGLTDCGSTLDTLCVDVQALAGDGLDYTLTSTECSLHVFLGCGLTSGTSGAVDVDLYALAGGGLIASESGGLCNSTAANTPGLYCCLAVNPGCGILVQDDMVVFNAAEVAGAGLYASGDCTLNVAVDGECITINSSGQLTCVTSETCVAIKKDSITCSMSIGGEKLHMALNWTNCDSTTGISTCSVDVYENCGA